ncbi:hypothetical protein IAU60_000366 [Kwoniella sp. DSM 27419]
MSQHARQGGSATASSSRMSSPTIGRVGSPVPTATASASASNQLIDPYRTLATQVKKPLLPLVTARDPPNLPTLLNLDPSTYSSRLSGKTLQSSDPHPSGSSSTPGPSSAISPLVTGRKRNRGYPSEAAKARAAAEQSRLKRQELGLDGLRRVRRRLEPSMKKGMRVSYHALLPLHHMHTTYIIQLLGLPRLPPNPSTATLAHTLNHESILSKLSKADFTGIHLSVLSSRSPSLVGKEGIVIEETASTFRLVDTLDRIKVVPKDGTLFRIVLPAFAPPRETNIGDGSVVDGTPPSDTVDTFQSFLAACPRMELSLLGSSFTYRSGDRAGRKFRPAQGGGGGSGWAEPWVKSEWSDTLSSLAAALGEDERKVKDRKTSNGAVIGRRKRNKHRRKDPPAGGSREVY